MSGRISSEEAVYGFIFTMMVKKEDEMTGDGCLHII